ncbi:MAG TPA: alpha/beta hydrolase fold domain-containing protein, partial [Naasia sp.]
EERRPAYLVGDSAGGGLALAALQEAQRTDPGRVLGATLISPWLDLAMRNPEIAVIEPHDPWLSRSALRVVARAWAGGLSMDDPRVSPLLGRLDDLPPLQVFAGTRDITVADCRVLRDRMAGAPGFSYDEVQDALHVYPLVPAPERHAARRAMVGRIRSVLPRA